MEPEHKKVLRTLRTDLVHNISEVKGIIDGLFAKEILNQNLKEKVEHQRGMDQTREILNILGMKDWRAFVVFHEVLIDCGESFAATLLFTQLAEQTEVKQLRNREVLQSLHKQLLKSITNINRVIDNLCDKDILTQDLKEKVKGKNGTDQLQEILDILDKKDWRAFVAFNEVLFICKESTAAKQLFSKLAEQQQSRAALNPPVTEEDELPAKWPDKESQDPFRVEVVPVPVENGGMKALFDKAVVGSDSVYAMHKPTRGVFLLISNEDFKDARANGVHLKDRSGTLKDLIALDRLFKQLHFRVETEVNLSAKKMQAAFRRMVLKKVEATDNCFACAVLTHGKHGMVYGVDGDTVTLNELRDAVSDNCPMLVGKPKVFFIQACQGEKMDSGAPVMGGQGEGDAASNMSKSENEVQELAEKFVGFKLRDITQSDAASEGKVPSKSDIFIAMAAVPGFVSLRNIKWGTWFVQAVVYIFSRFAHKYEINQLMTRVNKLVSRAETAKGFKQVSIYNSSLTSDLYFFPGLQHGLVESHS